MLRVPCKSQGRAPRDLYGPKPQRIPKGAAPEGFQGFPVLGPQEFLGGLSRPHGSPESHAGRKGSPGSGTAGCPQGPWPQRIPTVPASRDPQGPPGSWAPRDPQGHRPSGITRVPCRPQGIPRIAGPGIPMVPGPNGSPRSQAPRDPRDPQGPQGLGPFRIPLVIPRVAGPQESPGSQATRDPQGPRPQMVAGWSSCFLTCNAHDQDFSVDTVLHL